MNELLLWMSMWGFLPYPVHVCVDICVCDKLLMFSKDRLELKREVNLFFFVIAMSWSIPNLWLYDV